MLIEGQRVVTVEWLEKEAGHLTSWLVRGYYDEGQIGIICRWPRNGKDG